MKLSNQLATSLLPSRTLRPATRAVSWVATLALAVGGCGQKTASFSLLSDEATFQQNVSSTNSKMDILWVIDNSGSMAPSQANVANNFRRFLDKFDEKSFDYRMAVTTSDAYRSLFDQPQSHSRFRDGTDATSHTGVYVIEPSTPNLESTFLTNMVQGIYGHGDERAFQSIKETLNNPDNSGFPRPDAFLAVIIVSDEDDFSHDGSTSKGGQYSYSGIHTVNSYVDFLDGLTGATAETRRSKYNVSSIAILDTACKAQLDPSSAYGLKIGYRYMELSNKTNGIIGSLCGDFGTTLSDISNKIIELSTEFFLNRDPIVESIVVRVNGELVTRIYDTDPKPWNGYMYHEETNSITFHGSAIPGPGMPISVRFDPKTLK